MPWPPTQPDRENVAPDELAAFDQAVGRQLARGNKDAGYYGRLMGSPVLGNLLSQIGRVMRAIGEKGNSFTHVQREFVDQILSKDFKTNVIQRLHLNDALSAGIPIETIEAIRYGREEGLSESDKQLADYIRRVISGRIDKESYEAMEAKLGDRGTLEYTIFILFLQLTIRLEQAVGMPSLSDEELDRLIAEYRAGTREVLDYRDRIN
jgi:hypothetical protein